MAKPMTIAVSTSACGTGSARRMSARRRRRIGGTFGLQPADAEDEEVDGIGQQRKADDDLIGARPQDQPDAASWS